MKEWAKCSCGKEMSPDNNGCGFTHLADSKGKEFKRIPYTDNCLDPQSCHDCNVKEGKLHHDGCDMERCPKCHGQLLSCDCDWKSVVKYERKAK